MPNRYIKRVSLRLFIIIPVMLIFSASLLNAAGEDNMHSRWDSYVRYLPASSVKAMSGKVEIIESDAEYSYEYKVFDELPVKFSLNTQYIGIEETVEVELPGRLIGVITDIETTLPFFNFNETYLRLGVSPSFRADDWDFPASAFRIPFRSFLIYRPNARWTFIGGVAIYPDFFENKALPILGFIYKPNDKWIFNLVPERPHITYLINEKIALFAEGGGPLNSEFEVTQNNSKNVLLSYKETRLGGGIKFKPKPCIQSSLSAGAVFNRSLKYKDSLGKVVIKDGLYTEFRIEIEF